MTEYGFTPEHENTSETDGYTSGGRGYEPTGFQTEPAETFLSVNTPLAETPQEAALPNTDIEVAAGSNEVITDPELAESLAAAAEKVGPEALNRLLQVHAPFNHPVHLEQPDGSEVVDAHYLNKLFLKELVTYSEATSGSGIPPETAEALLTDALRTEQHPDSAQTDTLVRALAKGLRPPTEDTPTATEAELAAVKELIPLAAEDDFVEDGFVAMGYARKAGLSLADSAELVKTYLATANYRQIGYGAPDFIGGIETFVNAGADPELLKDVLGAITNSHGDERRTSFQLLRKVTMVECPNQGISADDVLRRVKAGIEGGLPIDDAILRVVLEQDNAVASAETNGLAIISASERIESRFRHKPGRLEHGILPYQTDLPLNEGMRDIEGLVETGLLSGETISEGAWVFDRDADTWYSLGGETAHTGGGARHTHYVPYEMPELSEHPVSVHIHPSAFSTKRGPIDFGFMFPSNSDLRYVAEKKQGTDLRTLIAHHYGVTEYTHPDDPEMIRDMSQKFQGILKDIWDASFQDTEHADAVADAIGHDIFAAEVVRAVNWHLDNNEALPRGFRINLYPHGTGFEAILHDEQQR